MFIRNLLNFHLFFYKIRHLLPLACLKQIYFAFIFPHILYGIEVYANTTKSRLDKLSKLNNKLIRILLNKPIKTPVLDLYKTMNVLPIIELHEMQMLIFVHKCLYHKDLLPDVFHDYFTLMRSVHGHSTRRSADLYVIRNQTNLGLKCSVCKCSKLWNLLPANLKINSSVNIFKKYIKQHLFSVAK